jgi:hypothetical protein
MDLESYRWLLAIRSAWDGRREKLATMLRSDAPLTVEARDLLAEFVDHGTDEAGWEARFRSVGPTDTEWIEFEAAIEYMAWAKTQPRGSAGAREQKLVEIAARYRVHPDVIEEIAVRMHERRYERFKLFQRMLGEI